MPDMSDLHLATLDGSPTRVSEFDPYFMIRHTAAVEGSVVMPSGDVKTHLRLALDRRRSQLSFDKSALALKDLATLLDIAVGCRDDPRGRSTAAAPGGRPYPSAGALYPVEILVCCLRVSGLAARTWYYQPLGGILATFGPDEGIRAADLFVNDGVPDSAAVVLLWSDFGRPSLAKYAGKEYRMLLLEAGHVMQNILLVATALGLSSLPTCGFADRQLGAAVGLDFPAQSVLYAAAIGGRTHD